MDSWTFDLIETLTWDYLVMCLEKYADRNRHGYWSDGKEILCKTEAEAEHLANFLEDIGYESMQTGYYDPKEDERDGAVDDHTGFYYVAMDW